MTRRTCFTLALLLAAGCMEQPKPKPLLRRPSLYTRLGGHEKVAAVVDRCVERLTGNGPTTQRLRQAFTTPDAEMEKEKLVREIGAALGAPRRGGVESLRQTLLGMGEGINDEDVEVFLRELEEALKDSDVGPRLQKDVMRALAPMRQNTTGEKEA